MSGGRLTKGTTLPQHEFTITDLVALLRACGGEDEDVDLYGDILDVEFEELGYDSLALLETAGRIQREYDITLDDATVGESRTPRALLAAVNDRLLAPKAG